MSDEQWPPAGVDWYYADDWTAIAHGDCREILPTLPKVDLVLTDPPYNSGIRYGDSTDDKRDDYWDWLGERIGAMMVADRVLVKHSALKINEFVAHHPSRMLIWVKPFSSGFPYRGVATHFEPIHLLKGDSCRWSKDYFECSAGNSNKEGRTGHPAQMPESVQRWLVNTFSDVDHVICDPFMGSGTTLRAAKDLNRKAIGIEIEEKYCEIAANRMAQEVMDFTGNAEANECIQATGSAPLS